MLSGPGPVKAPVKEMLGERGREQLSTAASNFLFYHTGEAASVLLLLGVRDVPDVAVLARQGRAVLGVVPRTWVPWSRFRYHFR